MKQQAFNTEEDINTFYRRKSNIRSIVHAGICLAGMTLASGSPIYSMMKFPPIKETPLVSQYIQSESNLRELQTLRDSVPLPSNLTNYSPEIQTHINQAFQKEIAQRQSLEEAVNLASVQLTALGDEKEVRDYLYQTHVVNKNRIKNTFACGTGGFIAFAYGLFGLLFDPYLKRKKEALAKLRSPK